METLEEKATNYYNADYPMYKPVPYEKCKDARTVRAFIAGYKANELNKARVMPSLPFMDGAYPLTEVLKYLIDATDILLHKYDYDGHNWEILQCAMERGKSILKEINGNEA